MALIGTRPALCAMALPPRPGGLSSRPASRAGAPSLPQGSLPAPCRPLPSLPRRRGRAPLCPGGRPTPLPGRPTPLFDLALSPPGVHPFPGGWLSSGSLPGSPTRPLKFSPLSIRWDTLRHIGTSRVPPPTSFRWSPPTHSSRRLCPCSICLQRFALSGSGVRWWISRRAKTALVGGLVTPSTHGG